MADRITSFGTITPSPTTKGEQPLAGQTCWLAVAENEPSTHTRQKKETTNVRQLTGCPDENACRCAVRCRDSFDRTDIGGYACACVRRMRSELPSRSVGRLQMGRPESGLVPQAHGPCGRIWTPWKAVVQVRRLPSALPSAGRRRWTACDSSLHGTYPAWICTLIGSHSPNDPLDPMWQTCPFVANC
jgi:hypothetical protein